MLHLEVADLALEAGLARQRLTGEVLAAHRQRLLRLVVQLLLSCDLQLHALAAGGDVGHAAACTLDSSICRW